MRILSLGPESFGGFAGIAQGTRDFLTALRRAPDVHEILHLARHAPDGGELPPLGIEELHLPGSAWRFTRAAARAARTRRYDLVFCLHLNLMPVAAYIRQRYHLPVWLVTHGIEAWSAKSWVRGWSAGQADRVTSSSRTTLERFLEWAPVKEERCRVINNPVDLERFTPGPRPEHLEERYGLAGRRVLLTLGQLRGGGRTKGHDEILDVLPELVEEHPELAWLVVGDGPDLGRFQRAVQSHPLRERVVFAGRVPEGEKVDHYRLADAFALPSCTEGFGIAYLEAAACGVPVLGSVRDGSRDALSDGELGLLVDPLDRADLLAGLRALLAREKGVPEAIERFAFGRMQAELHDVLGELRDGQTTLRAA